MKFVDMKKRFTLMAITGLIGFLPAQTQDSKIPGGREHADLRLAVATQQK